MSLEVIRSQIDVLDGEIITLLSKRAGLVSAAGKLKKDDKGVRDPKRVGKVIAKIREKAISAGLDPSIAEEIYSAIIGCFVRKEMKEFTARSSPVSISDDDVTIRKATDRDRDEITAVFNHYVEHSFAAYPEHPVDGTFYDFIKKIVYGDSFFVVEHAGNFAGFAFLKRYHAHPAFDRVAEVGYFLQPEYAGKGLGLWLLHKLEQEALALGVDTLLANISSHNGPSLAFHEKNGFRECGRFRRISRKFGQDVDIVWMQKFI